MNIWTWILVTAGAGLVGMLLKSSGQKARRRYDQWYSGSGKMLEDYDAQTKEIDKFSR